MSYTPAEFNTFLTFWGCTCAVVQVATGWYAAYRKKKTSLIKTNDILFRSHRAFGGFATALYFLGLFAGMSGFIRGLTTGEPPFEISSASYNVHVWPSFAVIVVIVYKTYLSYFRKGSIYKRAKWLGIATFLAWAFTWLSSAVSYYLRIEGFTPGDAIPQDPPPTILLPVEVFWLQLILPFALG